MTQSSTALELWTNVRFMLYPVMFVFGMGWGMIMARQYHVCGVAALAWSAWLGFSVMILGAAGFASLLIVQRTGFTAFTSSILTIGMIAVTTICVLGTVALWCRAWKNRRDYAA